MLPTRADHDLDHRLPVIDLDLSRQIFPRAHVAGWGLGHILMFPRLVRSLDSTVRAQPLATAGEELR